MRNTKRKSVYYEKLNNKKEGRLAPVQEKEINLSEFI